MTQLVGATSGDIESLPKLKELVKSGLKALQSYPEAIVSAFVAGFYQLFMNNISHETEQLFKIFQTIPVAIVVGIVANMRGWAIWQRALSYVPSAALLYWFWYQQDLHFTLFHVYIFSAQSIFLHLLVAMAPLFANIRAREMDIWHFNKTLFLRVCSGGLLTGVLMVGVFGVLSAIEFVFHSNWGDTTGFQITVMIGIVFSTWYFAVGIGAAIAKNNGTAESFPRILKFLCQYILITLLILFSGVIAVYWVKLALAGKVPAETFVLWGAPTAFAAVFVTLMLAPLVATDLWIKRLIKSVNIILLAIVGLIAWGIVARVGDYGWTLNRYAVVLACFWSVFVSVCVLVRHVVPVKLITAGILVISFVVLLPLIGAEETIMRSQINILMAARKASNSSEQISSADLKNWPQEQLDRAKSALRYLQSTYKLDAILERSGLSTDEIKRISRANDTALPPVKSEVIQEYQRRSFSLAQNSEQILMNIPTAGTLLHISISEGIKEKFGSGNQSGTLKLKRQTLLLDGNIEGQRFSDQFDLSEAVSKVWGLASKTQTTPTTQDDLTFKIKSGDKAIWLYVSHMQIKIYEASDVRIEEIKGYIFVERPK